MSNNLFMCNGGVGPQVGKARPQATGRKTMKN